MPKQKDKYLFEGKLWIDVKDYSVVRIEGHPAKKLSFWIQCADFVRQYQNIDGFWLPQKDQTLVQVRLLWEENPEDRTSKLCRECRPEHKCADYRPGDCGHSDQLGRANRLVTNVPERPHSHHSVDVQPPNGRISSRGNVTSL